MTLVTATVEDNAGNPDDTVWLFSSTLRESGDGSAIITPKWVRHKPISGLVSINLDPGYCIVSYRGSEYVIQVPDSGPVDLWDLIAASVAFPPGTSPSLVGQAVMAYLSQHEISSEGLTSAIRSSLAKADTAIQPDLFSTTIGPIQFATQRIMRPNGPLLGGLGDSLHSLGTASTSSSMIAPGGPVIMRRLAWLSRGRIQLSNPHQDPGDTMDDVINTQLPALLADPVRPNACFLAIGRNNAGASFNLTSYLAQYESVANQLFAAGICPIFLTPMPAGSAGAVISPDDGNLRKLGAGLMKLGARIGVPVFDQYAVLADETGGIKAIYSNGVDNTHLNAAGYEAVAGYLIKQGFLDLFPGALPRTIKDTVHPNDVLAGAGLFKSATPAGFSVAGTGTSVTYVNPDPADGIAGRWAKVTRVDGSTTQGAARFTIAAGVTPGKVYRFSGVTKIDGAWGVDGTPSNYLQVAVEWRTGSTLTSANILVNRWDVSSPITFCEDFVAPAGVNGFRMVAYLNGTAVGAQNVWAAEWSALNLTDMGV